jgi:hypothetical protein
MAHQDQEPGGTGELVKAATVEGSAVAEWARARLDAAGITAHLHAHPHAAHGVELGLLGDVDIMVPAADVERARQVLKDAGQDSGVSLEGEGGDRA